MMKKRYLLRRYGLAAAILVFLLIWISQQNATDNNVSYTLFVQQQATSYNHAKRQDKDSQPLQQGSNPNDFHETKRYPEFTSHDSKYRVSSENSSSTSVDSRMLSGTDEDYFVREGRSRNSSLGDLQRSPITDDEMDADRQRYVEEDVRHLSLNDTSDSTKRGFRSTTAAKNVDKIYETATPFAAHTVAKYRRMQITDDSALNSRMQQQSVSGARSRNQSFTFDLIFPSVKPSTTASRQRVRSFDDDADDSLVLARQLSRKNFVKVDEKHPPTGRSSDETVGLTVARLHSAKSTRPDQYLRLFENTAANSSSLFERKQETDELNRFAEVPAVPDYDLPMLKEQTSVGGVVSTSFVRPKLVDAGVFQVSHLVSNKTVDEDGRLMVDEDEVLADTDDVMSGATVLGEINPNRTYAVFSTTTENREALNFIFLLPLTALAWKRVGFDCVVIVVGPVDVWNADDLYHFVLSAVRQLDAVVVFLEPRPEKSVMISQVSRIFIANILRARAAVANRHRAYVIDDTYMVTSDADIWPIYGDAYRLPTERDVLSLNSDCCGAFSHRNVAYRMLPMANVGMRIRTWRRVTRRFGESPRTVDDILTAVVREFGPVALRPVRKGYNVGWFLDQMMVSLLVAEWSQRHGAGRVKFVPRDVGVDRLDRNAWGPGDSAGISDKIDAHLLGNAYLPGVWARIVPLISHLYGFETDRYIWCMEYYDSFQKLFVAKYRSQGGIGDH